MKKPSLVTTGWLLFILCLILPVIYTDKGEIDFGWKMALGSIVWISFNIEELFIPLDIVKSLKSWYMSLPTVGNLLILFSPISNRYLKPRKVRYYMGVIFIAFGFLNATYLVAFDFRLNGPAYYLWVLAFFVSGIGLIKAPR